MVGMTVVNANEISPGTALGKLTFAKNIWSTKSGIAEAVCATAEEKILCYRVARDRAAKQFDILISKMKRHTGENFSKEAADVLEGYRALALDPELEHQVIVEYEKGTSSASQAVLRGAGIYAERLRSCRDEYLAERAADVEYVSDCIVREMALFRAGRQDPETEDNPDRTSDGILFTGELSPTEVLDLKEKRIEGVILEKGAYFSHSSILLRSVGIPAVSVGDEAKLLAACDEGTEILLESSKGKIIICPDDETVGEYEEKKKENAADPAVSGQREMLPIRILCNISSDKEADRIDRDKFDGIGLFRTEYLYLSAHSEPSEEEQFLCYSRVLSRMGDKEVVIRTCDIGADKKTEYPLFDIPESENPALAPRGIRLSLQHPDIFRKQLRALYRASAFGRLKIMFPMVSDVNQVIEAKKICEEVRKETAADPVPIGVMIETPAAAVLADELAKVSDFFSIGTNDLTMYTTALDRELDHGQNKKGCHPAVLKLMRMTVEAAHENNIPVGVCGELAADPELAEFFLRCGMDSVSVGGGIADAVIERMKATDIK